MAEEILKRLINQLNTVIIGKEEQLELAAITLLSEGHLLIEDIPGVGKTTLANALAASTGLSFGRIQFTPDTLPGDITGISIFDAKTGGFRFIEGSVMKNIVLADEINRTSPKTQASLLEAMEEKQVTVDGVIHVLDKPFMVIATQNPIDFLGTYNLPEAQLDRFFMRISLGYPTPAEECSMVERYVKGRDTVSVKKMISKEDILRMQAEVKEVAIHNDLIKYIIDVISETRKCESISLGASPRASLAVVRGSQAAAYMQGRDFVTPDDIKKVFCPILAHRIVLSAEELMQGYKSEHAVKVCIKQVDVPVLK